MTEYGIFDDCDLVEGQFWQKDKADAQLQVLQVEYEEQGIDTDFLYVAIVCPFHEEEEADCCESCFAQEAEDEEYDWSEQGGFPY